ncbi:hypothetical protein McpSp1_13050 [Methanocorpusculaceae archaeon Sp1]|uniref:Uncharacterized protein n=1 Tax=Methanorbis furvi TaxID=3028299 RepID=A0AAE4MBP4_9EURY|nr:hypothetical protein [Methanocorpusculaceae archaeon Sp1]MDV0441269.1 hypothetical protein [Methanocorpusculaceae archaeon Ag1]
MKFFSAVKEMLPFLLVCGAAFYVLPTFGGDTGFFMVMLLIILPLICFASGFFYGFFSAFHPMFSLLVALLFLPTVYLYYNVSALVYALAFLVIAFVGNVAGWFAGQSRS